MGNGSSMPRSPVLILQECWRQPMLFAAEAGGRSRNGSRRPEAGGRLALLNASGTLHPRRATIAAKLPAASPGFSSMKARGSPRAAAGHPR